MTAPSAAAAAMKHTVSTAAGRLIQRRATTGSVSSVFYLQQLAHADPVAKRQALQIERVFKAMVGAPLVVLGTAGLYRMTMDATNDEKNEMTVE